MRRDGQTVWLPCARGAFGGQFIYQSARAEPTPCKCPAGANLDVDVPWKYLNFFLDDDERLAWIGAEYGAGRMLTGEIKAELIQARSTRPCRVTLCPS